ncbi:MAG: ABC transporter permease [Rhodospirillaceae bacterium]|jgi:putative ABC transport system permease protein|nr:ABC transporter permease [Rhodospirillaceae bacterium]MBT5239869.1 ABC transporter permease [Rhodospirillaceae bacterium]MBT5567114.1 ABC transporter permease [Rhodospirillaceae bacterium]MBT6089328.1 ABC transporter permease [Rhodospirillaceae bacterium]MBT6960973.1 ABC transporter permease [Rhodospirillaceae bacterium]
MKWQKNLRFSFRAINRSRPRALLSISGVAIGIAAVAILIGAGAGAERAFQKSLEQLGENLLAVNAARTETDALRGSSQLYQTLKLNDWEWIKNLDSVKRAAPVADGGRTLKVGRIAQAFTVLGTTPEFQETKKFNLVAGRFIDQDDIDNRRRVAVVGANVVSDLYFGEWPLGERLQVGSVPFTIIGILKRKGLNPDGTSDDGQIIVPVTTAQRRVLNTDYLSRIFVQAVSQPAIELVNKDVTALLRDEHGYDRPNFTDDFEIQDQDSLLATQNEMKGSFGELTLGLAALALGLGGVGLLAVSLLSVRERYGEIGLRMAVGARPQDILAQFLTESVLLALMGGVAGILVGGACILVGSQLTGWAMVLTWEAATYPFIISLGIAVVFGAFPALRAARLDPIVALRSK